MCLLQILRFERGFVYADCNLEISKGIEGNFASPFQNQNLISTPAGYALFQA